MSDLYAQAVNSLPGRLIAPRLGLPRPVRLQRGPLGDVRIGAAEVAGPVLVGAAPGGRLGESLERLLEQMEATVVEASSANGAPMAVGGAGPAKAGADGGRNGQPTGAVRALIFDATGIEGSAQLVELQRFFHPNLRRVARSGRIVVLGTPPDGLGVREATAQRALEGFTRSLGKEVGGRGVTVQLLYVAGGAEEQIDSTMRFLLSPRSAYVSGQVVRIGPPVAEAPEVDWSCPLAGRRALVTGASRGIGEAIARVLHRDGAQLVLLDVPAAASELRAVAGRLGADSLELDITAEDAPARLAEQLSDGVDVVVHNAGITRDRTIAKMPEERWQAVIDVNLTASERIDGELIDRRLVRDGGRIVCVSSMSAIAGNAGQTNYATSKAGVIGRVRALAPILAVHGVTINAVAPGFIETQMTAKMPIALREAGRRMNSLSQGGLPVDVAETIAWLACPASGGVNGAVVRVCGQSLLGA